MAGGSGRLGFCYCEANTSGKTLCFKKVLVQIRRLLQDFKYFIFQIACFDGSSHRIQRAVKGIVHVGSVQCQYSRTGLHLNKISFSL